MAEPKHLIARKTVAMQVTEQVRAMILSGELASGEKLGQEKLAMHLGVSRVPVREALNQLEAEGLVKMEVHKGAVVSGVSIEALNEMYELRALLEPWLIGRAIPRMTAATFEAAEKILDEMLNQSTEVHWTQLNWAFHHALYEPAERPQSVEILERLYVNTYRHFPVPMRFTQGIEVMDGEHRHLLSLCRAGEARQAGVFLRDHIMRGSGSLVERMRGAGEESVSTEG